MKKLILLIILFTTFFAASSQSKINTTTYFDKDFKPIKNKAKAVFYRPKPVFKNGLYLIQDFYIDGAKQWDGAAFDKAGKVFEGKCTWYNKDGTLNSVSIYKNKLLKETILYGAANYIRKVIKSEDEKTITGVETFYLNSQLKQKIEFKPQIVLTTYYNNKGKIIGKNTNEDKNVVGEWITFNEEEGDGESIIGKSVFNKNFIEILRQLIHSGNGKVYQEKISNGDTGEIISDESYVNGK